MKIVYILTNEAMPDLIKIGRTNDLKGRLKELNRPSGVPLPFECAYAAEVADDVFVEAQLHKAFAPNRVNPKREFFEMDPVHAIAALKIGQIREVTPSEQELVDPENPAPTSKNRSRTDYSWLGLKIGDTLTYCDDENITCKIVDNRHIEFNGEITSPSAAVRKITGKDRAFTGPGYWLFEGESLWDRRKRMELEGTYGAKEFRWDDPASGWNKATWSAGGEVEKT